ncbi:MAG: LacI family DNA-binding transcriptional regulator [Bacteroidota bacterium]
MANIKDIAKHTGLSVATISRVFNNSPLVRPKTRKKVLNAAKELDYRHNISAASLRSGVSKIIGVLVPEISNVFFAVIINGIEKKLKESGYNLIIAQSHESAEQESEVLFSFQRLNVDGVLISIAKGTRDYSQLHKMKDQKVPFVYFDRVPPLDQVNAVTLDDYQGATMATRHLLDVGCRNIIHIAGDPNVSIFNDRRNGFLDTMNEAGVTMHEDTVIVLSDDQQANKRLIADLLEKHRNIDGFFAHGDVYALYVLDILKELKVSVPHQVKVVGFGNADFSAHISPSLTTIDQNGVQMGQMAAATLIDQLQAENNVYSRQMLAPQLIIRHSTQSNRNR